MNVMRLVRNAVVSTYLSLGWASVPVSPLWLVCVCDDRTVMTDCIILAGGRQLIVGGETTGDWRLRLGNYVTGGKH